MNAPGSEELTYAEDTSNVAAGAIDQAAARFVRNTLIDPCRSRSGRFLEFRHRRDDFRQDQKPRPQSGMSADSMARPMTAEWHTIVSGPDRYEGRTGLAHDVFARFGLLSIERNASKIMAHSISSIQRITRQSVLERDDRSVHELLAVTERNRGSSPSDRHLRDSAATTTGGAVLTGLSPAVGDS